VLTAGGNGYSQGETYSPPYLFRGARPAIASAPTQVGYSENFVVTTPDVASIARVTLVRLASVTHGFDMNQRFLNLNFTQTPGSLNVSAPGNPNLAPPGHYMLFLLNASGVPSIAKIVNLTAIPSVNPVPTLTSLTPSSAAAGGPAFTLTVGGTNFVSGAAVRWNGTARTTSFTSATQVSASITAADLATAGTATVTVVNPAPGGGASNGLPFAILSSFTLTVGISGNGSGMIVSTPAGIACGSDCSERYAVGTAVTLTAIPATGSTFAGWTGSLCPSNSAMCTITVDSDKSINARFRR
jgi:hypothetical protein